MIPVGTRVVLTPRGGRAYGHQLDAPAYVHSICGPRETFPGEYRVRYEGSSIPFGIFNPTEIEAVAEPHTFSDLLMALQLAELMRTDDASNDNYVPGQDKCVSVWLRTAGVAKTGDPRRTECLALVIA